MSFFETIRTGNVLKIKEMIEQENQTGVLNPLVDLNGGMSIAAQSRNLALAKLMYQTMKDRNAPLSSLPPVTIRAYNWAMDSAAQSGSMEIIRWILQIAKADGEKIDPDLPMRSAAYGGHLEIVKLFRAMGGHNVNGAVVQAVWMARVPVVMYLLLECGATDWTPALRLLTDPAHLHALHDRHPVLFAQHKLTLPPRPTPKLPPLHPTAS